MDIFQAFKYIQSFVNKTGEDITFKKYNIHSPLESKVVFIRYMLQVIEKKRGYVGDKTIIELVNKMEKAKIYKIKDEKDMKKAIDDTKTLLKYIYNFDNQNQISSIKT